MAQTLESGSTVEQPKSEGLKLRWLDLSQDAVQSSLVAEALDDSGRPSDQKDRALEKLGITRAEGDGHLQAWIKAMCSENDLEYRQPQTDIAAALSFSESSLRRFVFWLA